MLLHHLPRQVNVPIFSKARSDGDSNHIHAAIHSVRHENLAGFVYRFKQFCVEIVNPCFVVGDVVFASDLDRRNAEADGGEVSRHRHFEPLVRFYPQLEIRCHFDVATDELLELSDTVAAEEDP